MYEDIHEVNSYDYQTNIPDIPVGYDNYYLSKKEDNNIINILRQSAENSYPYIGYSVDLTESNNQVGCFNTCKPLADLSRPNTIYDFNSCMESCAVSGTSSGIIASKRPRK